jgi:hypothetical protein
MSFWIPNFSLSKIPRRGSQFVAGNGSAITFKKKCNDPQKLYRYIPRHLCHRATRKAIERLRSQYPNCSTLPDNLCRFPAGFRNLCSRSGECWFFPLGYEYDYDSSTATCLLLATPLYVSGQQWRHNQEFYSLAFGGQNLLPPIQKKHGFPRLLSCLECYLVL